MSKVVVNFDDVDSEVLCNIAKDHKVTMLYKGRMYPSYGVLVKDDEFDSRSEIIITEELGHDKIFVGIPLFLRVIECHNCKLKSKCERYKVFKGDVTLKDLKDSNNYKMLSKDIVCINDCTSRVCREYFHDILDDIEDKFKPTNNSVDKPNTIKQPVVKRDLKSLYAKAAEFDIPESVMSYYAKRLNELCKSMEASDSVKSVFTEHFINGTGAFNIAKKLNTDIGKVKKLINRSTISACVYMKTLHPELMVHIDEDTLLCDIKLPESVCKSIDKTNLSTLGDIAKLYKDEILSIPRIGKVTVQKIIQVLDYGGIKHNLDKDKPAPIEVETETPIVEIQEDVEVEVNWEEKYKELLSQVNSQQEIISNQSRQIQLLQNRVSYKDKTYCTVPIKLEMDELFEDELYYNILNVINFYYKSNKDNPGASRTMDIVKAILEQNQVNDIRGDLKQKLSEAMPDGAFKPSLTPGLLSAIGFSYDKNGDGHYYVYPDGHKEYGHSISATPSDHRTSDNQVNNIIKIIFGR